MVITGALSDDDVNLVSERLNDINLGDENSQVFPSAQNCQFNRKPDVNIVSCAYEYIDVQLSFDIDKKHIMQNELLFFNSVIGEGDGSILSKEIREKRGLTYDIHSCVDCYEDAMLLNIVFSTQKQYLYEALEETLGTLQQIKQNITNVDIDSNIQFFTENLWYWLDDCTTLNFELGCDAIFGNKLIDIEERVNKNKLISCERLKELAKFIFVPSNATITIVGKVDRKKEKEIKNTIRNHLKSDF